MFDPIPDDTELKHTSPQQAWEYLLREGLAFWRSFSIEAAFNLGIFDALADEHMTVNQLAIILNLKSTESLKSLLCMLRRLGILNIDDYGKVSISEEFSCLRDNNFRQDIRSMYRLIHNRFIPMWARLSELVSTGLPQSEAYFSKTLYDGMYENRASISLFADAMVAFSKYIGQILAYDFNSSVCHVIVDVGGGTGAALFEVLRESTNAKGIVFERPELESPFLEYRDKQCFQVANRTSFVSGNFFEKVPKADIVMLGQILHNWGEHGRRMILRRCYEALSPGGCVVVYDPLIDPGETTLDEQGSEISEFFDLQMRLATHGGTGYTFEDLAQLLEETGFENTTVRWLIGPFCAVYSYKSP